MRLGTYIDKTNATYETADAQTKKNCHIETALERSILLSFDVSINSRMRGNLGSVVQNLTKLLADVTLKFLISAHYFYTVYSTIKSQRVC